MSTAPCRAASTCGLLAGLLLILGGCDAGPGDSLFDPDDVPFAPDPVITSVEPSGSALAGVDVLTITGENFSTDLSRVRVFFDAVQGDVLETSPTQIKVRAPNFIRQELRLRVMVIGAENLSNGITYRLDPAASRFGSLLPGEEPFGIATDSDGYVYVSMFDAGVSLGIKRFAPDGTRSDYFSSTFSWTDLAFGPDGVLYGVRGVHGIFRLPAGQAQETFHVLTSGTALIALEFDADGALWTAASGGAVYRIFDGEAQSFAFPGTIRDMALHEGHLYVALTEDGVSRVVRAEITGPGELGPVEEHTAISAQFGTEARRMAFAADGSLIVGTQAQPSLILVHPDGAAEIFYEGIVAPPVRSMAWGPGTVLYAVARVAGDNESVGRERHDLIRIETRREGA